MIESLLNFAGTKFEF